MLQSLTNLNGMSDLEFELFRNSVFENKQKLNIFHAQNGCDFILKSMTKSMETDDRKYK